MQEALHNCEKHSGATQGARHRAPTPRRLLAEVEDNGRGFSCDPQACRPNTGLGLLGMRERAAIAGGTPGDRFRTRPRHSRHPPHSAAKTEVPA